MEKSPLAGHYLEKYDEALEELRSRLIAMGKLAMQQLDNALLAVQNEDSQLAEQVIATDAEVNRHEMEIDNLCSQIIARHQPAASDLRFVIAVIRIVTDLERISDQTEQRVAQMVARMADRGRPGSEYVDINTMGQRVLAMLDKAVVAFDKMDAEMALEVVREDLQADRELDGIVRQQITFMMEDPRTIGRALDILWALRALKRISDHTGNICEHIIYLVKGADVRHAKLDEIEAIVRQPR